MNPDKDQICLELIGTCKKLKSCGLLLGVAGNLSLRWEESGYMVITPSAMDYDAIQVEDIVVVDLTTGKYNGRRKPSIEAPMHLGIYQARKDIGAIIHIHSPYATALACARRELPVFAGALVPIGHIPLAPFAVPGSSEMASNVVSALGPSGKAVLQANHGLVVTGSDMSEAVARLFTIERAAHTYLLAAAVGGVVPLGEREIKGIEEVLSHYGQEDIDKSKLEDLG